MKIVVWDLPLRLFHWLLVVSFSIAYVTAEISGLWLVWHEMIGLFIISLILFRVIWGFVGSEYSRFSHFLPTPKRIEQYYLTDESPVGHSPLGALSVFTLLIVVFSVACLGLFSLNDDAEFYGPFYDLVNADWVERLTIWHAQLFDVSLIFIVLHILAILFYLFYKKNNLIYPMITGVRHIPGKFRRSPDRYAKVNHLLTAIVISIFVFWILQSGFLVSWILSNSINSTQEINSPSW